MRAKINVLGHAVHPILVVFPLGLLTLVPVFDIVYLSTTHSEWALMSFWMLTCGLIGGLLAAVFGLADFLQIPRDTRAFRVGLKHLGVNVTAVAIFGVSWIIRLVQGRTETSVGAFVLAVIGVVVLTVGGWLGGELVERLGVSVHSDADLNATSSLQLDRRRPRHEIPIRRGPEPTL